MIYRKTLRGEVIVHLKARVKASILPFVFTVSFGSFLLNQMDKQGTYGV